MTYKRNTEKREFNIGGKVPPNAVDLESVVVGIALLEKGAFEELASLVKADMFYNPVCESVFKAMAELFNRSNPIDLHTVSDELKKSGKFEEIGGILTLIDMTDKVVSSANLEYHCHIIIEKYVQRQMIIMAQETVQACYEGTEDVFDIVSKAEVTRESLLDNLTTKGGIDNSALAIETLKSIKENMSRDVGHDSVPSGFKDIDAITGGWQPSDLIILAARPGMGKTSLAIVFALNAAKLFKKPVAMFSLEMSVKQLMNRQLSIETGIDLEKFKHLSFNEYEMKSLEIKTKEISRYPIIWDDTASLSVFELRAKCRRMKRKNDIKMVIIDYLQLMTTGLPNKNSFREQDISFISRSLKAIAKELNIVIIALSQLSRDVEKQPGIGSRPKLSHLRESGAIEQDADMVTFLYRPEYYGIATGPGGYSTAGIAEFIIAKNRNGKLNDVEIKFIGNNTNFVNTDYSNSLNEQPSLGFDNSSGEVEIPF